MRMIPHINGRFEKAVYQYELGMKLSEKEELCTIVSHCNRICCYRDTVVRKELYIGNWVL